MPRNRPALRAAIAAVCAAALLTGAPAVRAATDEGSVPAAHGVEPAQPATEAPPPTAQPGDTAPKAQASPLPLVPTTTAEAAPRPRGPGLRIAGWTLFSLGAAATVSGLALIPARDDQLPLTTVILPTLAAGAAAMLIGQMLVSADKQRRRPGP